MVRVRDKMLPFWPHEPALWFAQIERKFNSSRVTQDATKFYNVVAQLDSRYIAKVQDIIISPPTSGKYDKIKNELIKRLSASQEETIERSRVQEGANVSVEKELDNEVEIETQDPGAEAAQIKRQFVQIERQFKVSNVTQDTTKFYSVIAQLDSRYIAKVKDIIISPPTSGKYHKLTTELIKRLSASQEETVEQPVVQEEGANVKVEKELDDKVEIDRKSLIEIEFYADCVNEERMTTGPVMQQVVYNTNSEDASRHKKPRLEIRIDKTGQVMFLKETKENDNDFTCNVDCNENTPTDIRTKKNKEDKEPTENYNLQTKHLRVYTGGKLYACSLCGHKFAIKSNLSRHLNHHAAEKSYSCSLCKYICNDKSNLTRHLRIHTGEKPYSCSFCKFKCNNKFDLTKHLRIHTGENPHSCSFCGYKSADKSSLSKHLHHHHAAEQSYSYSCSICKYKCTRKSDLITHVHIHTGEKPYACSFCDHKFTRKDNLSKHLRIIHAAEKSYSCSFCMYKSYVKSDLTRHSRIHTGEKPYSCSLCKFKCSDKSNLSKHLKHHDAKRSYSYSCSFCKFFKCNKRFEFTKHLRIYCNKSDLTRF